MWIEETKSGKFKFVEQYTDYMTGKRKRVSVTMEKNTAATRRTALETLMRMIEERQNEPPEQQELTLEELVGKYREYQKMTVKESTYRRNFHQCNSIMKILGKDVLINHLTANYIKERFLSTGKEAGTLNEHRIRLLALLNWAYENDYINDISFTRKFKPFKDKTHREKIQDKYLEHEELSKLIQSMKVKKWELLTRFLSLSGLRIGEAAALTVSDIDWKEHVIHVTKTYDANNHIVDTPKTLCSIRDVYIQQELEPVCREILLYTKMESLACGYRTNLFLCSDKGDYICPCSYNKYLRENAQKVIGRRITAHTLRHTHASLLLANGTSIDTISRRLGHENSSITREIYLHVTEKLIEKDNEQIKTVRII
jgi:integrase